MNASPIKRASEKLGGAAKLAEVAGVSIQAAYQWINGDRPIPAERAPVIANASGVPIEELCPSVPWHLVGDTDPQQLDRSGRSERRRTDRRQESSDSDIDPAPQKVA